MSDWKESEAHIDYTEEENDRGRMADCVIAECLESGDRTEPVWGHGERSVKRALATLTEHCSCRANYHAEG